MRESIKIPITILSIALGALVAIQAWTLKEVVELKVQVGVLNERITTKQHYALP